MKASDNWEEFDKLFHKAMGEPVQMELDINNKQWFIIDKKAYAAVAHAFLFCLYVEQIGMGVSSFEIECITLYAVYEQPIWGNMAFPPAWIIADE